tara:strand:+ start:468 stop:611 length:144 start_codon:yes stop_codon:yes gene_type:complete
VIWLEITIRIIEKITSNTVVAIRIGELTPWSSGKSHPGIPLTGILEI